MQLYAQNNARKKYENHPPLKETSLPSVPNFHRFHLPVSKDAPSKANTNRSRIRVNRDGTSQSSIQRNKYRQTKRKKRGLQRGEKERDAERKRKERWELRIPWFRESKDEWSLRLHLNGSVRPSVLSVSFGPSNRTEMCHTKDHRPFCRVYEPLVGSRRVVDLFKAREKLVSKSKRRETRFARRNEWKQGLCNKKLD